MIEHFYYSIEEVYNKRINDSNVNKQEYEKVSTNIKNLNFEL